LQVYEGREVTKILGSQGVEAGENFKTLHSEQLRDLYVSLSAVRTVKCRRLRWAEYVARLGETRDAYRILVGKLLRKLHLEVRGGDG